MKHWFYRIGYFSDKKFFVLHEFRGFKKPLPETSSIFWNFHATLDKTIKHNFFEFKFPSSKFLEHKCYRLIFHRGKLKICAEIRSFEKLLPEIDIFQGFQLPGFFPREFFKTWNFRKNTGKLQDRKFSDFPEIVNFEVNSRVLSYVLGIIQANSSKPPAPRIRHFQPLRGDYEQVQQ